MIVPIGWWTKSLHWKLLFQIEAFQNENFVLFKVEILEYLVQEGTGIKYNRNENLNSIITSENAKSDCTLMCFKPMDVFLMWQPEKCSIKNQSASGHSNGKMEPLNNVVFLLRKYGASPLPAMEKFTDVYLLSNSFCFMFSWDLICHLADCSEFFGDVGGQRWWSNYCVIGGRWYIITQLAVYTTYIPLYIAFWGGCMLPTSFYGNQKQPFAFLYSY